MGEEGVTPKVGKGSELFPKTSGSGVSFGRSVCRLSRRETLEPGDCV